MNSTFTFCNIALIVALAGALGPACEADSSGLCGEGLAEDDHSCSQETDEDESEGDGEGADESEGESEGEGEGDEPSFACGDGVVEGDEECDDGNEVDDDGCSNACTLPACGDGIIQAELGETCDDGNTRGGDWCASTCLLPGTVIWSRFLELPDTTAQAVAVAPEGNIAVLASSSSGDSGVLGVNEDGELMWSAKAPPQASGLAVDPTGGFVIGGVINHTAQAWHYAPDGVVTKSGIIAPEPVSTLRDLSIDGFGWTWVLSTVEGEGGGLVMRFGGNSAWVFQQFVGKSDRIVAAPDGGAWVLRANPRQVLRYTHGHELAWSSIELAPVAASFADLAVDSQGNAYVVGDVEDGGGLYQFGLSRISAAGQYQWTSYHGDEEVQEAAYAVTALPRGGVVTAGYTSSDPQGHEADALLSWYGPDGIHKKDFVFDGPSREDVDWLQDVATDPMGNIVALGVHHRAGGEPQLWVLKIAI
ncbi:MAG: DUF4215 domain-containing protein [Enhygromyxa sp.]